MRRELPLILVVTTTAAVLALALVMRFPWWSSDDRPVVPQDQSRRETVDFVRRTTEQLDVDGWWPRNGGADAEECSAHDGESRRAFWDFDLLAPRGPSEVTDPSRAAIREHSADVIADYWRGLGMTVSVLSTSARYPTVYAQGGPVSRAVFDTGGPDDSFSFSAASYCQPGDVRELWEEDAVRRADGVVLPGDEGTLDWGDPLRTEKMIPTS